jgi:hypothetical protein
LTRKRSLRWPQNQNPLWLLAPPASRGRIGAVTFKLTAVALASKQARIAFAILRSGEVNNVDPVASRRLNCGRR